MKVKPVLSLFKETFDEWKDDEALQLGAALAYYTIFSLAPTLLVVIAIAGLFLGREAVQGQIVQQIGGLVGTQGAEAIQTMIANAAITGRRGAGMLATIVGFVTLLFGATGVFAQLQTSLNHIWDVQPKPDRGIKGFLKARAAAFGMLLGIGFLLLVSLVVSAALAAVDAWMVGLMPGSEVILRILSFVLSLVVVTVLLAMIYRYLPDVKIAWRDVWIGAVVTALLFTLGRFLIGLYLGKSSVASVYGAAGSLVILLLWIYYSAQILFLGAELTQVYARRYGSQIVPDEDAMPIPGQELGEKKKKTPSPPARGRGPGREGSGSTAPKPASGR